MRQNIADFLYFNFLGRTSKKKHPVEVLSIIVKYNSYKFLVSPGRTIVRSAEYHHKALELEVLSITVKDWS